MRPATVKLLVVLVCALLAAWYFSTHEKRVSTEFVGYSGEARYNEFLMAELFLQQVDIEADSRSSWTPSIWLPDVTDTIVSRLNTSVAVQAEQEILLEWVSNGGHLVMLPSPLDTRATNRFLATIGVEMFEIEASSDDEESEQDAAENEAESDAAYVIDLDFTYRRIEIVADDVYGASLSDDSGVLMARRGYGSGFITIMAVDRIFMNRALQNYDHSRLLLDTVAGFLAPGKVWFVLNETFPSLWQLIVVNAKYAVITAAAVLLLWLWSIIPRFGPPIDSKIVARRSIIEHVFAAGHFTFRHSGAASLIDRSVKALAHEADIKTPGFSRMSPDDQAKHLAVVSGLPAQDILDILLGQHDSRRREFTHNVQTLQHLRKKL